jgi:Na+/phosphate symporter
MKGNSLNAKKVALTGILGALTVICVLFAAILPTNRLSLYAVSSFFISAVIIESGLKTGWLFFGATSLLSLIVVPEKIGVVPYVIFFGVYGLVKFYIEKLKKLPAEVALKLLYFNVCLAIALILLRQLFSYALTVKIPWWLIIVLLEIVFFIYDVVYTLFINYYREKLKPKLRI